MQSTTRFRNIKGLVIMMIVVGLAIPLSAAAQLTSNKMVAYSTSLKDKAKAGNADSQVALGVAYLQGNGVERRYDQAELWFQKAYAQGSRDAAGWLGGHVPHRPRYKI